MYDVKCLALAKHFLSDANANRPPHTYALAQAIQDAVEAYFVAHKELGEVEDRRCDAAAR